MQSINLNPLTWALTKKCILLKKENKELREKIGTLEAKNKDLNEDLNVALGWVEKFNPINKEVV